MAVTHPSFHIQTDNDYTKSTQNMNWNLYASICSMYLHYPLSSSASYQTTSNDELYHPVFSRHPEQVNRKGLKKALTRGIFETAEVKLHN